MKSETCHQKHPGKLKNGCQGSMQKLFRQLQKSFLAIYRSESERDSQSASGIALSDMPISG